MTPSPPSSHAQSFEHALRTHRGLVLKVAASYAGDGEDRADLAQEIALQLWRAWPTLDPTRPAATWMYRIALNVALTWRRTRRRRPSVPLADEHAAFAADSDLDPEAHDRLERAWKAIRRLPPLDRALLLMHLEGCSHRESADVLGTTEGNVATRLGRVRDHLRRIESPPTQRGDNDGHR